VFSLPMVPLSTLLSAAAIASYSTPRACHDAASAGRAPAMAAPRLVRVRRAGGGGGARMVVAFDAEMFAHYENPERFPNTDLRIVEFPNPILRAPNAEITEFDDDFRKLCDEFFSVMYGATGVGLAAPQVGLNLKLFVYNPDPSAPGALRKMGERVVANPKILEYCQTSDVDIEGCLSSRAECCRGDIRRAKELNVEYQDERGRVKRKKLRGFEARVFQHEFDHINGVLHIDRQSPADRERIQPFLDVLVEQHGPGGVLDPPEGVIEGLGGPPRTLARAVASAPAVEGALQGSSSSGAPAPKKTGFGGGAAAAKSKGKGKGKRRK